MLTNYLKIALRLFRKQRSYALLNLAGLSLGLTCCLLIALYVQDELGYDRFHPQADRIVLLQQFEGNPSSGGKFATDLKSRFAAVANAVRINQLTALLATPRSSHYESQFFLVDSTVFDVFSVPLLQGNPATALAVRDGLVLSEKAARKYFPNQNPIGQRLRLNNKRDLLVTGVMRDWPGNSHWRPDFLASYARANEFVGYDVTTNYWGGFSRTYLLLAPGAEAPSLQAQLPGYVKSLNDPNAAIWKMNLIPLTDLYLRTNLIAENRLTYVYIFSVVALLILGLACFNYVNLATARATQRAKEVGVRKVLGSSLAQLWRQFLGETTVFLLLAVAASLLLAQLALPSFNELADKTLSVETLLSGPNLAGLALGIGLISLLTGGYPAFVLSTYKPTAVLKGQSPVGTTSRLRQVLVVGQFAASVVMIVATLVVYAQLNYIRTTNVGYQREHVLTVDLRDAPDPLKARFKDQVGTLPAVAAATRTYGLPGSGVARGAKLVSDYVPKGAPDAGIRHLTIDGDYLKTFGIRLLQGRNLDPNRPADKQVFLVNKAAMKYFGWETIAGKMTGYYTFQYDPAGGYREVPVRGEVVGVIDDYHHADLKQAIEPMIFSLNDGWEGQLAVRIRQGGVATAVPQIRRLWSQTFPDKPFEYRFLDDTFNQAYRTDSRTGQVFGLFAVLAVLISCLGLLGLVTFMAQQRTREIGIRKVLGASVLSLVSLLSKDFLKLVGLAILIASPLAAWAMHRWLQGFAYKIALEWWMFASAGLLALVIALLTVSFQAIRAARVDPVQSLKVE